MLTTTDETCLLMRYLIDSHILNLRLLVFHDLYIFPIELSGKYCCVIYSVLRV